MLGCRCPGVCECQQMRGCRCPRVCECQHKQKKRVCAELNLCAEAQHKLQSLLQARTALTSELTKPRMCLHSVQDRRVDYVMLSAIDESLRRVCAHEKNPVDCCLHTGEYIRLIDHIFGSNAHNSVQLSAEKRHQATRLCTLALELGNFGPCLNATMAAPYAKQKQRKIALDELTQGDSLHWGTDPHYQYKSGCSFNLRAHPAVLGCGSDVARRNAMHACCSQVLLDRQNNMLSPLLAEQMMQTLLESVALSANTRTCAPVGIPTIKQTPQCSPEQVLELLKPELHAQWQLALGLPATPDWSRQEKRQLPAATSISNYSAQKKCKELQLAMAADTQRRDAYGELVV